MTLSLGNDFTLKLADFEVKKEEVPTVEDMLGFGLKNSTVYRALFMESTKSLTAVERYMVVYLATAVKNKQRILDELAREKFNKYVWRDNVVKWYRDSAVQYTAEKEGKFSVVHIPSSVPSIAAHAWAMMRTAENRTKDSLLENLWAAQLALSEDDQKTQMEWEKNFWDKVVTKTRRADSAKYEKGFHEEYYNNKKNDKYELPSFDFKKSFKVDSFDEWVATFP